MERPVPDDILRDARRLGPLPWSALGRAPAAEVPAAVVGWLGRLLDRTWGELGRPDPFVVVDAGAGDGSRAAEILASGLECATALRWLLVDDEADAPARQRARLLARGRPAPGHPPLVLEDPVLVLGPAIAGPDPDEAPAPKPGTGPVVASLPDLPAGLAVAVVLAVGWLSRLPADRFEWRDGRWWEVRMAAGAGGRVEELLVEAGERSTGLPATGGRPGERVGVSSEARRWLGAARHVAGAGWVVAVDRDPASAGGGGVDLSRLAPDADVLEPPPGAGDLAAVRWSMAGG